MGKGGPKPPKQQALPPVTRDETSREVGSGARTRARRRKGAFSSQLTGESGFQRSTTLG